MLSSQTNLQGMLFRPFEDQYLITPLYQSRRTAGRSPRRSSFLGLLSARRSARKTVGASSQTVTPTATPATHLAA